jgi:hypothetical protein
MGNAGKKARQFQQLKIFVLSLHSLQIYLINEEIIYADFLFSIIESYVLPPEGF